MTKRLPLSDIAMASVGHLGQIAEVAIGGHDRPRIGNNLYGAFGRDFASRDGERLMVMAALMVTDELFDARADVDDLLEGSTAEIRSGAIRSLEIDEDAEPVKLRAKG